MQEITFNEKDLLFLSTMMTDMLSGLNEIYMTGLFRKEHAKIDTSSSRIEYNQDFKSFLDKIPNLENILTFNLINHAKKYNL